MSIDYFGCQAPSNLEVDGSGGGLCKRFDASASRQRRLFTPTFGCKLPVLPFDGGRGPDSTTLLLLFSCIMSPTESDLEGFLVV